MIGSPLGNQPATAGMILTDGITRYLVGCTVSGGVYMNSFPVPPNEEAIPFPFDVVAGLRIVKEAK